LILVYAEIRESWPYVVSDDRPRLYISSTFFF
jgi:hypothetical protein